MHRELEIESPRYIFGSFFEPLFLNKVFNFDIAQAFGIWKLVHRSVSISVISVKNSGDVRAYFMSSGGMSFAALPFLNLERTDLISAESGGQTLMLQLADIARSDSMNSGGLEIRDSGIFLDVSHVKCFLKCSRRRFWSQPELGTSVRETAEILTVKRKLT